MRRSHLVLATIVGVYIMAAASLAWWLDRQSAAMANEVLGISAKLVASGISDALAARPGPLLPADEITRNRLRALVSELTDQSDTVVSLTVVRRDGKIVASDEPTIVGSRVVPPDFDRPFSARRARIDSGEGLATPATYRVTLPVVRGGDLQGAIEVVVTNHRLETLLRQQRQQIVIAGTVGLVAVLTLTLLLLQQLASADSPVVRAIQEILGSKVVLDRVVDDDLAAVFDPTAGPSNDGTADRWLRSLAAIAHEVKAPLHAITLNLELLARAETRATSDVDENKRRRYLRVIRGEMERLQRSVEMLGSGDAPNATDTPLDLRSVIESVGELLRAPAESRGIHLELSNPDEPAWIVGVEDRLRQALLNVANNGLEVLQRGETLTIALDQHDRTWRIAVADSGPGIAPDVLRRAESGPFTTKTSGRGIGLYIARAVVEAHRGELDVSTAPDRGTTWEIFLPRAK